MNTGQEFEDKFVDLESTGDLPLLTDSVYGWFTNGGGPCYVCRIPATQDTLQPALTALEENPDVTMVAVPGLSDIVGILPENQPTQQTLVVSHCQAMGNRVALLDLPGGTPPQTQDASDEKGDPAPVLGAAEVANDITLTATQATFATVYYPWMLAPSVYKNSTARYIPPSGHVAGTWARTDTERGVYTGPGERDRAWHTQPGVHAYQSESGAAQPGRHQLPAHLPRPGQPGLGRQDPGRAGPKRPGLQVREHPPGHLLP